MKEKIETLLRESGLRPDEIMRILIKYNTSIDEINSIRNIMSECADETIKEIRNELKIMTDICDQRMLELSSSEKSH